MWKYLSITQHLSKINVLQQKNFQAAAHGHKKLKLKVEMAKTIQNSGSSILLHEYDCLSTTEYLRSLHPDTG